MSDYYEEALRNQRSRKEFKGRRYTLMRDSALWIAKVLGILSLIGIGLLIYIESGLVGLGWYLVGLGLIGTGIAIGVAWWADEGIPYDYEETS